MKFLKITLLFVFSLKADYKTFQEIFDNNKENPAQIIAKLKSIDRNQLARFRDKKGNNLLHLAANNILGLSSDKLTPIKNSYILLINFLVQKGVPINAHNNSYNTPLDIITCCKYTSETIDPEYLKELGAIENYRSLKDLIWVYALLPLFYLYCNKRRTYVQS